MHVDPTSTSDDGPRGGPIGVGLLGYADPLYCRSLREFGRPRQLRASGGWVLERTIPGHSDLDAMGPYPLFSAPRWDRLQDDVDELRGDLVSLIVVTDPFAVIPPTLVPQMRGAVAVPWKDHFVVDLTLADHQIGRKSRRRNAAMGARAVECIEVDDPTAHAGTWLSLHRALVERLGASGLHSLSATALTEQLAIPGASLMLAYDGDVPVAADLYLQSGDVVYSHLGGVTPQAYPLLAGPALTWFAIQRFRGRARWLDLGGGAGLDPALEDGLTAYKRSWSTQTLPTSLLCVILDEDRYAEISRGIDGGYFPAYRAPEVTEPLGEVRAVGPDS